MSLAKQFSNKLEALWKRRTAELRSIVIPQGVGQPLAFSPQVRDRLINDLLDDASEILVKRDARAEFKKTYQSRHLKKIKGHGLLKRGKNLVSWAGSSLKGPIIYAFWSGSKCLYLGKGKSWRRLKNYDKSAYLLSANSVEVFCISTKNQLGKAECLATHLFEPRDNQVKAARVKWGKECPVCREHDRVRDKLKDLFR